MATEAKKSLKILQPKLHWLQREDNNTFSISFCWKNASCASVYYVKVEKCCQNGTYNVTQPYFDLSYLNKGETCVFSVAGINGNTTGNYSKPLTVYIEGIILQ